MKLAILHAGDLNGVSPGGVDRYIKSLLLGLDGVEVTLFGTTKAETGYLIGEEYMMNYQGASYSFIPVAYDAKKPLSVHFAKALPKYFRKLRGYDCIYSQRIEFTIPFLFSPLKKKVFQIVHGSSAYSSIGFSKSIALVYPAFERLAINIASRTYVILNREEFGVPYYKRLYPGYSDKIFYARNPIDYAYYSESVNADDARINLRIDKNSKVITYLGRVVNNPKRVNLLPQICLKVKKSIPNVLFLIVGDGEDLPVLKEQVEALGLSSSFVFAGYINDSEIIRQYLSLSDVTINISSFEGTCTSILESLASKTPVVATDVGDIHECLYDGRNGVIIPNDNESNIENNAASAIVELLCSPLEVDNCAEAYDLKRVGKDFLADIEKAGL